MKRNFVDWCSAQLFRIVHHNNLIYNACWEDPRIDEVTLDLKPDDRVLMITSAGCNVLHAALKSPKHIYAVDVNPRQNALLELKIAGIRTLDFDTYFSVFGKGLLENYPDIYHRHLRPELSSFARKHWDKHLDYFTGSKLWPTFYFRGTSGMFARMASYYINLRRVRESVHSLFEAGSLKEQAEIYRNYVQPVVFNRFLRNVLRWDVTLSLLGVPRPQRYQVEQHYNGGIVRFIEDCMEAVFTRLRLDDNYFWWLYFTGHYSHHRCPEYLKRENFEALKDGLVNRISLHTQTIADFLKTHHAEINRFTLLDHMDWLSAHHKPALQEEWQAIVDRAGPNTRLIWRSGGLKVDYVDPIEVKSKSGSWKLGDLLTYHTDWARQLSQGDRVHTYGSFYIADLATT